MLYMSRTKNHLELMRQPKLGLAGTFGENHPPRNRTWVGAQYAVCAGLDFPDIAWWQLISN